MSYSFWHCGVLIGESDLDDPGNRPRQLSGVFRPTSYGIDVFPRLTGILTAGHALKEHLDVNGLVAEDMEKSEIEQVLDTTPAGRKIIDIGRALSEVEVRAPDGRPMEFASIAFIDLMELKAFASKLGDAVPAEPNDWPTDSPRYTVSATFIDPPRAKTVPHAGRLRRRRRSDDN